MFDGKNTFPASEEKASFLKALKPTFIGGIIFGQFRRYGLQKKSKISYLLLVYSGFMFIILTAISLLMLRQFIQNFHLVNHFMGKIGKFVHFTYMCSIAFTYGYNLFGGCNHFQNVVCKFSANIEQFSGGGTTELGKWRPSSFLIFCWVVPPLCLILGIAEDTIFEFESFDNEKSTNDAGLLCHLFGNYFRYLEGLIPPENSGIYLVIIISAKLGHWGWLFADTIVVVLCQALAMRFQNLDEVIKRELIRGLGNHGSGEASNQFISESVMNVKPFSADDPNKNDKSLAWSMALEKFSFLAELTLETERYVAPLILSCYTCVGSILIIVFVWIAPGDYPFLLSKASPLYIFYSAVYYCFRLSVVTHYASKVYHSSRNILGTVEKRSCSVYCDAAERLERKLIGNPVGIRLFGTFLITRHSFVSIIGFIFTTEIVLLQMSNAITNS